MNEYVIRKREKRDCLQIAHIVTVEWNNTYKGIVPDQFLNELKAKEKEMGNNSEKKFDINDNNQLVLEVDNKVVGFVKYGASQDGEYKDSGEVFAIYILKEYHGFGYGKKLINEAKKELKKLGFNNMIICCLKGNPSNEFYKHIGGRYIKDGLYNRLNLPENVYFYDNI